MIPIEIDNPVYKGVTFPNNVWGVLENITIDKIKSQILVKFPTDSNLLVNGTWFSPNISKDLFDEVTSMDDEYDNVFFLTTVDPAQLAVNEIIQLFQRFGSPTVYFLGNFDHSQYEFNFISWALTQKFKGYSNENLILTDIKYKFINYNRKPKTHRENLVSSIKSIGLDTNAIVTLGKDMSSDNSMYVSIGEKNEDFVETGHWFDLSDTTSDYGIPHDLLSLGDINYWKHHFLNVVSETEFNPWDPIFVTEKTFKPIVGLRPFIINGNTRTYSWLRNNGFKTFTHYFPFSDLETINENEIVTEIIKVLNWINNTPNTELMIMYNDMLPDLKYNKERFYEFAKEQKYKMDNLF
jgi:hypothetical protein